MKKIVVISSYPKKGTIHGEHTVGIASYAKNTLLAIQPLKKSGKQDLSFVVLAEKLTGQPALYREDGMTIKRVWQRGSLSIFPNLLKEIRKENPSKVMVELELSMFGNVLMLGQFLVFLATLKLLGKKVIVVSHQVVDDIEPLSGHVNIANKLVKSGMNLGIKTFYSALLKTVDTVVVFEEELKNRLGRFGNLKKIVVIPHLVETPKKNVSKQTARKKLGIKQNKFVILYFGFVAWYKGADWFANQFPYTRTDTKILGYYDTKGKKKSPNILISQYPNIQLIIAGGPNPNHMGKQFYQEYIEQIKQAAEKNNILYTGFIPEDQLGLYFAAADLVVLPYRAFMSSSGPLAIAASYGKPMLLSEALKPYAKTADIRKALKEASLQTEDLIFSMRTNHFNQRVQEAQHALSKLERFSSILKKERSAKKIGAQYLKLLHV